MKQTLAAPVPEAPLPALLAAWQFLEQPLPFGGAAPSTVVEFWTAALAAWNPDRLPPVPMLPAPPAFRTGVPAGV